MTVTSRRPKVPPEKTHLIESCQKLPLHAPPDSLSVRC